MTMQWSAAARLVRRTGFGATGADVDAVAREGASAYVARILGADPTKDAGAVRTPVPSFPRVAPIGKGADADARKQRQHAYRAQDKELTAWWLRRMAAVEQPFGEKLTFVWHQHFATSLQKVKDASYMAGQIEKLRTLGRGDFHDLAYAVLTDPATLKWLDGARNTVKGPNENLAREFMEIFTLGHDDGYTETDVREGARALTGMRILPNGAVTIRPALHDQRPKTLFGTTSDFDPSGYCDAVLSRPGSGPYVLSRLWSFLVSDTPASAPVATRSATAYGPHRDLRAALASMLTAPAFTAAEGTTVIGPVEWMVGAIRSLRVPLDDEAHVRQVSSALTALGQLPLYPPSVGGWPTGRVWLSTAAADLRFRAAGLLTRSAHLPALTGSTTAKLEAVAHLLGVATWSDRSRSVLSGSTSTPQHLVAVALNTPEYLVH